MHANVARMACPLMPPKRAPRAATGWPVHLRER